MVNATTLANFSGGSDVTANSVAVAINTTGTLATQNDFLVQLKAAIEHANGHNGEIVVSAVPTEANGAQAMHRQGCLRPMAGFHIQLLLALDEPSRIDQEARLPVTSTAKRCLTSICNRCRYQFEPMQKLVKVMMLHLIKFESLVYGRFL